jgi:putative restriction endonuclease
MTTGTAVLPASEDLRRYAVIPAKQRLHQAVFRQLVIEAYDRRCAVSGLPEACLLHAARIPPDRDKRGLPVLSNGIAVSMLHDNAYELNLMGIDPDGVIYINRSCSKFTAAQHSGTRFRIWTTSR